MTYCKRNSVSVAAYGGSGRVVLGSWPDGHCGDSEDIIQFSELKGIETIVMKYPLDKAQEAYEAALSGKVRGRAVLIP